MLKTPQLLQVYNRRCVMSPMTSKSVVFMTTLTTTHRPNKQRCSGTHLLLICKHHEALSINEMRIFQYYDQVQHTMPNSRSK